MCQLLRKLERGIEPIIQLVGKRTHEKVSQRSQIRAGQFRQRVGRLSPQTGHPFRPQPFMNEDGEAEHVGPPIPDRRSRRPLGSGIRSSHRNSRPCPLKRMRDPKAGQLDRVGRNEHIARVQRAVDDLRVRRRIEGAGEVSRNPHRLGRRRRPVLPYDDVDRVGGDKIVREVRRGVDNPGGQGRGDRRVPQIGRDQLLEFGDQTVRPLGRKIQTEPFYRDEFLLLRIVRAKNGTERTRADLMENAKWTEGVRRCSTGGVRVQ